LHLSSDTETVHGLASWDEKLQLYNVLIWNFSPSSVQVNLVLANPPGNLLARSIVLDAATTGNDENSRLISESPVELERDKARLTVPLDPYGVRFWSIERQS
jgi:hypothetical protein